jgi:hypothetical protein
MAGAAFRHIGVYVHISPGYSGQLAGPVGCVACGNEPVAMLVCNRKGVML